MPKRDLIFNKPYLNAAGSLGFAADQRAPIPWSELGAFITNPISMRPRKAAATPVLAEFSGGFLLHTGLPNPGFSAVMKRCAGRWQQGPLPVIVHLMADRPEQASRMVQALEGVQNVMAAELGFAPLLASDIIALAVEMCRGELPLIVCLPVEQVLDLAPRMLDLGAAAVSLAAPRGTISQAGTLTTGRLFGPSLYPRSLDTVYSAARLGLPIIGAGGVFSPTEADAMLAAGALAVEFDSVLWLPKANDSP